MKKIDGRYQCEICAAKPKVEPVNTWDTHNTPERPDDI